MCRKLALSAPTRQARCEAWLVQYGVTKTALAKHLGIDPTYVGKIIAGERRPQKHIKSLIEMGVPADLLPEPGDGKPGPKPRLSDRRLQRLAEAPLRAAPEASYPLQDDLH